MTEPTYKLNFSKRVARSLSKLDKEPASQIIKRLERMANNANQEHHKALRGKWRGYFSLRVSDYRVIYRLDHEHHLIFVDKIGHRRDVYDE